ncbi:hypothetical protein HBH70_026370 [Parastagonospora nodorum]|nr:hypothetical protein HBH46_194450 [Parastagonospora nodorum]KAH5148427.1 hypothetical protein HBH70_026370 [Parastagonospora nodorum]KAH5210354.1 hypothetical protein HBH68_075560 [Parastagonospora nodorum]KAH5400359.1 hypothetical protein HBI47_198970 [Parastagonospora nodorum]KAH5443356.1 hypothetical protein HBI30_226590 [Parastagonospora nodorum]
MPSCYHQRSQNLQGWFPGHPCKYNNEHPRRQGSATSISVGGSYNASLAWSLRSLLSDIVIWKGTAVAIATFQEDRSSTLKSRNGDLIMRKTQSYYQLYWPKGIAPLFTENLGICMVWSLSTTSDIIPTD